MYFNVNTINATHFENMSSAKGGLAQELEPLPAMVSRLFLSVFICITGLVGNIAVCVVTCCMRKRSAVSSYIFNLAIADLGILAVCYPLTIVKSNDPLHWPLGMFFCKVIYPLSDIFYGASISSIVAIALDRYRAIVLSMRAQTSLKAVKWLIFLIWFCSFIIIVLPLFFVMEYIEDPSRGTIDCTPQWPSVFSMQIYVSCLTLFFYVIPLSAILWCYRKIAHQILQSKKLHKKILYQLSRRRILQHRQTQRNRDENSKALKILVPIVALFAITMLPFHVFRLCLVFVPNVVRRLPYPWLVFNVFTILLLGNSSLNPVIYSLVSAEFRQNMKRALRMQWYLLRSSASKTSTASFSKTSDEYGPNKRTTYITTTV